MRIMLLLYLLIWCQTSETLTDQLIDVGQNVTIKCDVDQHDVYWFLLKQTDSLVKILWLFSGSAKPYYFNDNLKHKYSLQSKHNLLINNVTIDELGVYYCMNTDTPPKFSDGTRLHISEPTQITEFTVCENHTVVEYIHHNQTLWQTLTIIFGLLNGVLIIIVIGLKRFAERSQQLQNTDLQQPQVMDLIQPQEQMQYAEVDFSKLRKKVHPNQAHSTYAALKLPKS